MAQLVNDYVKLEDSFKDRVLDTDGVFEKFGVWPNQIIDYLTLMGDASDGIMGVPGVGAKTAAKLLTEYGTLDNIIANVDQLKGKLSQNIKDNLDNIKLDHQLASIVCDLPLELDWHELKLTDPNVDALRNLYTELEFRNQLQSLDHPNNPNSSSYKQQASQTIVQNEVKPAQTIETEDQASLTSQDDQLGTANYHTVLTQEAWDLLWQRMQNADHFAIDTETTSLDYRIAEMVGFQSHLMRKMPTMFLWHIITKMRHNN